MLLAAVVVVLIVIVAVVTPRVRDCERYLSGFWVGDPAFLREAGLADMYLYVAPYERAGGRRCRQGYLVMTEDGGQIISNQGVSFEYSDRGGRWKSALRSALGASASETYRVRDVDVVYDETAVMPKSLSIGLHVIDGTLALYGPDSGKLYAFLYRDNEVSASANSQYLGEAAPPEGS